MTLTDEMLEHIIEGALMASGQTLGLERIQNLFDEDNLPELSRIAIILERLSEKCANRGYELQKVATGYRFQVKQEHAKWVSRLWDEKPQRYSRALLETLSIIAYRQPVTRGEIEDIRGVAVSSHITKTLLEREWIQVVGHRDVPGRPSMFGTTKMFLDYFNLSSLDQLPTLDEIQEIADANHALELEDKVEEGSFDFSSHTSDLVDSESLESAGRDLIAADAMIQAVEDAVFNRVDKDDEQLDAIDEGDGAFEVAQAEEQLAELDSALNDAATPMSEDELAEATIARMIAEQEALMGGAVMEKAPVKTPASIFDRFNEEPVKSDDEQEPLSIRNMLAQDTSEADDISAIENPIAGELDNAPLQDSSATDNAVSGFDEDELLAAMEEEMIAQLEAEQEQIMDDAQQGTDKP